MNNSILVKGLVLSSFLTLITVFVMYRSGKFDRHFYHGVRAASQTSPNGGPVTKISKEDSLKRKQETVRLLTSQPYDTAAIMRMRAASSKSMTVLPESQLLPSSKSGPVFTPRSVTIDTSKIKRFPSGKK